MPIEVLLAAGLTPLDINNIFVNDSDPAHFIRTAEKTGFPLNTCAWIKGIYGVCVEQGINKVICVTTGDCSNTSMLMEVLKLAGVDTIPFAYPNISDSTAMQQSLVAFAKTLGTTMDDAEAIRNLLLPCRQALRKLDELTWKENRISGKANHYWLVSSSDFNQNHSEFHNSILEAISASKNHSYPQNELRLAFIGVPPVFGKELYDFLEQNGARVVFNEIQRQFSMPFSCDSLAQQYSQYTYPYDVGARIADIGNEISVRKIDGIIHYVQAFCHRAIADIVFRHHLPIPILTIEGNTDFKLSQHMKTRLEAFIDMLSHRSVTQ